MTTASARLAAAALLAPAAPAPGARLLVGPHGQIGHCLASHVVRPRSDPLPCTSRAGCESRTPLGVQRALQDDDSSGLVDDAATSARVYPTRPQPTLGSHGGESLVDQPDGHRRRGRPASPAYASAAAAAGPARPDSDVGRPDHHLDGLALGHQARPARRRSPWPRLQRLDRGRDQPGGVAGRDPDPDRADVDAEPPDACPSHAHVLPVTRWPTVCSTAPQRLVHLGRVGAAALGDVVLAAATAAEHARRRPAPAHRP